MAHAANITHRDVKGPWPDLCAPHSRCHVGLSGHFISQTHLCHVEMPGGSASSELTMAGCVSCRAVCRGSNVFMTDTWPPIVRLGDFGSALKAPPTEVLYGWNG